MTHRRKLYSTNEQYQILNYIIDHSAYFSLKGNKIWKDMEHANICPDRTWQSMKEHFSRKISKNIQCFNIDEKEKDRIMNGFSKNYYNELDNRKNNIDFSDSDDDIPTKKRKITPDCVSEDTEKIYTINSAFDNANQNLLNSVTHDSVDNAIATCSKQYSNEDDIKIINFFKTNMDWLNLKYEDSVYEYLQTKCSFQKSVQSLKKRFLNEILPNLYKYNVMEIADMLIFYDKARVQIPEELVAIIDKQIEHRESDQSDSQTTCINNRNKTSNVSKESGTSQTDELDTIENAEINNPTHTSSANNIQIESSFTEKHSNPKLKTIKNISTQTTFTHNRHIVSNIIERKTNSTQTSDNSTLTKSRQIESNLTECNSESIDLDKTLTSYNISPKNPIKIISNIIINPGRITKFTKNSVTNTDKIEQKDAETQYYPTKDEIYIRCLSDNIMVKSNSVTHVFVLNTKENLIKVKENIENKFHIQSENIHELSTEDFNTLSNFRKLYKTFNKKLKSNLYKYLEEPIDTISKSRFRRIICPVKKKKGVLHLPLKKIVNHQTEICTGCKRKSKNKFHNKVNQTKNITATENKNITITISAEEHISPNISQTNETDINNDNVINETHAQSDHFDQSNVSIMSIESNNSIYDKIWDIKHEPKPENSSPRSINSSISSISSNDEFSQDISNILNNLICSNSSPTNNPNTNSNFLTQNQESSVYTTADEVVFGFSDNININDKSKIDYNPEITIKDEMNTSKETVIRSPYFEENLNISDNQNLNLDKSKYPSALTTEYEAECDYNFLNSITIKNIISLSDISSDRTMNQSNENDIQNSESNSSTDDISPENKKNIKNTKYTYKRKKSPIHNKKKRCVERKSITKERNSSLPSSEILKDTILNNFKQISYPKIILSKRTIDKIKNKNLNINHLNILTKDLDIDSNSIAAENLYLETSNKTIPSYTTLNNEGFIKHYLNNTEN